MRAKHPLAIATLMTAVLAVPVMGQSRSGAAQPDRRSNPAVQQVRAQAADPHLITIDFEGGTLADLVEALKAASTQRPVNIIYSTEAADIAIPPFEVADADLGSTLRSLAYSSAGSPITLGAGRMVRWQIEQVGDGIYAVQFDNSPQYISTPRGQMLLGQSLHSTVVHAITELTTGTGAMSADDVLSAIQAALAIEGADDETKIRYHEETGLIFARVTGDQGSVIEQTLMNLGRSMEARRRSAREASDREAKEVKTQNLQSQVVMLTAQNKQLRSRIAHLETLLRSRLNGEDAVPENPLGDEPTGGN